MAQRFTLRRSTLSSDSGDPLSPHAGPALRPKYGHYRVEKPVGKGAMGYVLKGYDESLERVVAIKVLSPELSGSGGFVERFRREAKALAALDHPGIASIFSFGEENGEHYFAMQWCPGGTLSDLYEKHGRIETTTAIGIMLQCAHALSAAWKKGLVHRDIKPANIMFDENSRVKIVDFGLSRSQTPSATLTEVSHIVGTPSFMAPEQARASNVDHRADIYSLGISFFFLLYEKLPFTDSTSIGVLIKHATKPLPAYDDLGGKVPLDAYKIVERMTQKDPAQRYQTYDELILDLERLQKKLSPGEPAPVGDAATREKYGPYVLEAPVGGGQLGKLYKSFDETLRRFAAVKILSTQFSSSPELIEHFKRRAQLLSSLNHPGIARFYTFAEDQGDYYFANEWCDGGSLADLIRRKGRIEISQCIGIILNCAGALSAAADLGVFHGNIRPKNMLFDESREIKIADFGWASRASLEGQAPAGNPIFIAPERPNLPEPDLRSDMYSLGITFCCMLYGIHPSQPGLKFDRDTISGLPQKDPAGSIPLRIHDILVRMTQEHPEHRYSDYGSLIRDLGDMVRTVMPAVYFDTVKAPLPPDAPTTTASRFEPLSSGLNLGQTGNPEIDRALDDLQAYLSDQLPPLTVSDSITLLVKLPPELTVSAIEAWVASQAQGNQGIYVSDFLYHAVSKIHLLREYKLIPGELIIPFVISLKSLILNCCPPGERELLEANLEQIEKAQTIGTGRVGSLNKPESVDEGPKLSSPSTSGAVPNTRFQHILRCLDKLVPAGISTEAVPGRTVVRKKETIKGAVLAEAARGARDSADYSRLLDRMKDLGMDRGVEELLKALSHNLPGWRLPSRPDVKMPENSNLAAIHGLIQKSPDPPEAASRFHKFVKTAVDRFNDGALPAAVSMIELAQKIIAAKEVQGPMVQAVLIRGHENLDEAQLRRYAEVQEQRPHLRKVLDFFEGFSPRSLLDSLRKESKRERRRLLLTLLECHGEATRAVALEYLRAPLEKDHTDEEIHFRRNLIHLMRHIPASQDEPVDRTADALMQHLKLGLPASVLKEALAAIAQVRHEKAERSLVQLFHEIESNLMNPKQSVIEPEELLTLADRVAVSLCRLDTPGARKAVIDHALKKEAKLGDARSRLAELSKADLSQDRYAVNRLVEGIKANLPLKVLGVVVPQREKMVKCVVEALSGTPLPEVRLLLGEVAKQYPDRDAGRAAAKGLSVLDQIADARQTPKTAGGVTGDLDEFGLPNLLLSLADSSFTGTLTLKKPAGESIAVIHLHKGRFKGCFNGLLRNEAALYQLFEEPQRCTFQTAKAPEEADVPESALQPVSPLVLEGIRRYDEVQQTKAIVPDDARLIARAARPAALPDEKDGLLFRNLWMAVQKGATVAQCDAVVAADSYRSRRLLAHWVQQGVIETA